VDILSFRPQKMVLLGNEAIARGALEAGVDFVSTYPGTPASEIGDTFFKIKNQILKFKKDFHFEYSTNEKVALEAALGASFCGKKSLVAMKHFGLNVCSDALIPALYTGVRGALVLVVADDVSCFSSAQSEQNSRAFSYLAHLPTLEPSDPQEGKDFTKLAFEISQKFKIPVMIRTTTRVSHQRSLVQTSAFKLQSSKKGIFIKDPHRLVTMPPRVLEMKRELLSKIEKIKKFVDKSKANRLEPGSGFLGVITSGICYLYLKEIQTELNLNLPILKLGFFYPRPEKKIKNFIKNLKKVLVAEELEPYLEREIKILAKESNPNLQIFGKNLLSQVGELKPQDLILALSKVLQISAIAPKCRTLKKKKRLPRLCPGCPYWLVFSAIKKAVDPKKVIFGGDIGCYMLFGLPPLKIQDFLSCMGSSVGIAHGIKKSTDQKLITFIGDSTFFHAGIPALINTVFNQSNPLIIVLDNRTTAMTGHQPHPGAPIPANGIKIEEIVKACKVKNLKVIDPQNQKEMILTIKEFIKKPEVSVIVARHPCKFVK